MAGIEGGGHWTAETQCQQPAYCLGSVNFGFGHFGAIQNR
jgi:hypothetical protein